MKIIATYTPDQVAQVAHVTRRTVYRWITGGHLAAVKVGPKEWRISQKALIEFLGGPSMLAEPPAEEAITLKRDIYPESHWDKYAHATKKELNLRPNQAAGQAGIRIQPPSDPETTDDAFLASEAAKPQKRPSNKPSGRRR